MIERLYKTAKNLKIPFAITIVMLLMVALYHFAFAKRIIPGVQVAGTNIGSMTYDQALATLQQAHPIQDQKFTLEIEEKKFELTPTDLALEYNWEAAVRRAFEVGRTGNFFIDNKDKVAGLIIRLKTPAFASFDEDAFNRFLLGIKGEVNEPPQNSYYKLSEDNKLEIVQEMGGYEVDDNVLYDSVLAAINNVDFSQITLKKEPTYPEISQKDLKNLESRANKIVFNNLKIKGEDKEWDLTPEAILDLISVGYDIGDINPEIKLDKPKFEAYLDTLGAEVNQLPRGKITGMDGGRVTGFELTGTGKEIDSKQFTESFKDALLSAKSTVDIPMSEVSGTIDPAQYGITSLLASGVSKFTGSARARINNLTLAADRASGVLVPPSGIYSFNKAVGEISGKTGYDTAYVISGGRTVLGEGGGVCQTSTTLFRAVLNAGLPVIARYPHAYRVSYYEIDSPVGLDASIYQPSLDFQFKNDTPNYILVTSEADIPNNTLTFNIYGTPDGRTVEISKPVVSGVSAPPAALYQETDTLPKGTTRQVDWAAWGASVYFTRTVTRDDQVLQNDTFTSRYQPWRAVYLVGTKE